MCRQIELPDMFTEIHGCGVADCIGLSEHKMQPLGLFLKTDQDSRGKKDAEINVQSRLAHSSWT